MIRFLFLIPVVLCLIWWMYLRANGHTFSQGRKGFIYILIVSAFIALVYTLLMWITGRQF
ncbi:hypothetical protein [Pseudidiomarina terrestris]|uniref:Succinyl-diaminopimelate desuccinylase n=1 Tax=Pseudidiomarina terrestris TaxID=2820060 RepID=A0AAW7QZZ3_9GAMM|nr:MULTISPECIES: hypothetical protein [unclassified Pseudidiomarina]MDN7123874.1 hypothetical protein [Pseudidiomarina sp. 1APP75-32.1]MDN7127628.1 hypothetical protein [Pseudidiomarina sp. 1APR75-33.1]MDN7130374.1 hypothetical protein [Pseudidiomarina sp. 1APR75-15]MDN7136297.1 hypothetical protein [Pseudidiomarina sp. 1ASP75-5]MDN7138786.1 hypothetical protein [Pseudidiomarina sp. 1ASP75-14]